MHDTLAHLLSVESTRPQVFTLDLAYLRYLINQSESHTEHLLFLNIMIGLILLLKNLSLCILLIAKLHSVMLIRADLYQIT